MVDPAFLTLLAQVFFLPLLFRGLFTAVLTVVVFFYREKNLCHDTIPFPVGACSVVTTETTDLKHVSCL